MLSLSDAFPWHVPQNRVMIANAQGGGVQHVSMVIR